MEQFVLQMNNIGKEYYGNKVLKGVSLAVRPGEIHALLGENGAGKSTLMNVLFGMPVIQTTGGFSGELIFEGKKISVKSPFEAMAMGIGMVHQEFMLIPNFTITENIKLNREVTSGNLFSSLLRNPGLRTLDMKTMNADARKALDTLGIGIAEWTTIAGLPVGYMQFVEIAREIDKSGIKLLVFDEPTAVLTESEADNLIVAMKKLAGRGIGILFITHRLNEVKQAADQVTILRDGELVATKKTSDTTIVELAELMVGRKVDSIRKGAGYTGGADRETILEVNGLRVDMPGEAVRDASLNVYKGEILGIGGLAGQGKIGIANGIMGLFPASGRVTLAGKTLPLNDTAAVLRQGLAFVSEDRRGVGLLLDASIEHNIAITTLQTKNSFLRRFGCFSQIDGTKTRNHALRFIRELDIRCTGPHQPSRQLSGGNQQKVCIARALTLEPTVLLVSEPTRGIDIGAKKLVLDLLVKLNEESGMTIILTSSELLELRSICDRIAIVSKGIVAAVLPPDASDQQFGLTMAQ